MAYAAYRDHEVLEQARVQRRQVQHFQVLHLTVCCADAWRVRQAVAGCAGAGVVRCEVLLNEGAGTCERIAPRARLMIRLAPSSYLEVLQALMRAVPSGELGPMMNWGDHLRRCGLDDAAIG